MLSEEEKKAIDYLKARLHGNESCKFIDVAQSDLRIFLNLVENQQKDIENWKKYCDEQENDITLKNNKICDLEFKIEKQSKEIEELKEENLIQRKRLNDAFDRGWVHEDKIKAKIEEIEKLKTDDENSIINKIVNWFINQMQSLLEKE